MNKELVVSGCKSPERNNTEESYPFSTSSSSSNLKETYEDQIIKNSMEPIPSTSRWFEEESLSHDVFISWKKDILGTICNKLSEPQRSAFIVVST